MPVLQVKEGIYFIIMLVAEREVFSSYILRLLSRLIPVLAELWQTLDTKKCKTIYIPYQRLTK